MGTRLQYGGFEKRAVECFDFETNEQIGKAYESMVSASRMLGVSVGAVTLSCQRKPNKRRGSHSRKLNKKVYFKYKEIA